MRAIEATVPNRGPAQRQRLDSPDDPVRTEAPQPFPAWECGHLRTVRQQRRVARHLEQIAAVEIHEDEAGSRVDGDVAEGVEVQIAREVRNGQTVAILRLSIISRRAVNTNEAGPSATVRHVHLPVAVLTVNVRGDEKRIRPFDHDARRVVQARQLDRGTIRRRIGIAYKGEIAALNVSRTVAEGLLDGDGKTLVAAAPDRAVQTIAATRAEFDAEQRDGSAVRHASLRRIGRLARQGQGEAAWVGRRHESRPAGAQGRHGSPSASTAPITMNGSIG